MKGKISKIVFLFSVVFLIGFIQIENINAQNYSPNTLEEFKTVVESSQDGDEIDVVNLSNGKSFDAVGGGSTDLSSLGDIEINKNITIYSSKPEKAIRYGTYDWIRAVFLSNISFNVGEGKTLTLKGHLYLMGPDNHSLVHGDGNLILNEMAHMLGTNGHPAIDLPRGKVTINNLTSFNDANMHGINSEKYYSLIRGGDSKTSNGGSAIKAKDVEVRQENLDFKVYPNSVSQGVYIRGGHSLAESGQGGYALEGEKVLVNLSGEKNTYATDPIIAGGSGPYGAGAIKGKNIEIECAGNGKIVPGNGISTDTSAASGQFKYGVIEVEDGGTLNFGTKEVDLMTIKNRPSRLESMNSLVGGDGRTIFSNGNDDASTYFKGKTWNNFYAPVIWAKGDASVNIYRGHLQDKGANPSGPKELGESNFMYNLPISPVIEMDKGKLTLGKESGQTDTISIVAASHVFNTSEAIVKSNGDVHVNGENTVIEGTVFTSVSTGSESQVGYAKNPIAPKAGAAGIKTSGKVYVNAANICGGTISNIYAENGSKKDEYRFGSGIVGASEVKLVNGAVVQGYGPIKYLREKKLYNYPRLADYNVSAGYGLENVGNVFIEDSEVHGGDIQTVRANCQGSIPGSCAGNGRAGDGIKGASYVEVKGDSLITGGSSINNFINNRTVFVDRLQAGSGINNAGTVIIKGNVQVYGGGSSTKAGHGIANSKNIILEGDAEKNSVPIVIGGACRNTMNTGQEISGSGIYKAINATIKAGKVEAGDKVYQMYLDNYKTKVHNQTRTGGYNGTSDKANAISGTGKIIIDGDENFTPQVKSFYTKTGIGWFVPKTPIASIGLTDTGAIYVGKAKVYSGGDENYRTNNILVNGGKYHVDIFKENTINAYTEEKENENSKGIKYKAINSTGLYRILTKDKTDYINDELKKSVAYDDIFLNDFNINLYKEKEKLGTKLLTKELVRKDIAQVKKTIDVEKSEEIERMLDDNILINEAKTITYDANKPSEYEKEIKGDVPSDKKEYAVGDKAIVLGSGNMSLEGYEFLGWNTMKDGSGQLYKENDQIVIKDYITLYAQWKKIDKIPDPEPQPEPQPEPEPEPEPEKPIVFKPHDDTPTYKLKAILMEDLESHLKYIYGYPEGTFKPEGNIKRAEVMAIIARGEKYKLEDESKPNYEDAKEKAWYNKYINACAKAGILKEKEGEKLRAEEAITRAELADIISRITNKNDKKSEFTDIKGHWAEEAINQGYGNGILTGYPDKSFKPDNTITRAETVIIINALYNRHPDKDYIDANENEMTKYTDLNNNHWAYYEIMEASESHKFVRVGEHEENWKELIKDLVNN